MKLDLNEADSGLGLQTFDVCVCGTGPAGITVARKLAAEGMSVALLEAGGVDLTDESQDVYEGENVGLQYWGVSACRLRQFGGTSNHWAGRCSLFAPVDFEDREYFGLPGWPISRERLLSSLPEASSILDLGSQSLEAADDPAWQGTNFGLAGSARSAPTRFGEKYGAELEASDKITLVVNANVVDVELAESGDHVVEIQVRDYSLREFSISAKCYVIAFGAIENARFLLNCNRQQPAGIGNHSDMLGRCFMEHLNASLGRFVTNDAEFWERQSLEIIAAPELVRELGTGNVLFSFGTNAQPRSYGRLRVLRQALRNAACSFETLTDVSRALADFDCPGDGLVTMLCEQAPNLNSRVMLGEDEDRFGLRRVRLDWQIDDRDRRTVRTLALEAAKELAKLDLARVQLGEFVLDEGMELTVGGHCHHMGTTRMSADPKFGVVDPNMKVHGLDNLFIAGSSVFPTSGATSPTLSIVLLSLILADHIATSDVAR